MWILYCVIILVNTHTIYGNEIISEIGTRVRRQVRYSDKTSTGYNTYQSYSNYVTTPRTSYNNFVQSTAKYSNIRYDNNYYYNNNNRNNAASVTNRNYNNYPEYNGNYNYETTPTSYTNYLSSTYKYNNVRQTYNNNNMYNGSGINHMSVTNTSYNEYNSNYNYDNNGIYNRFNNTGYNTHRFYNLSQINFPGYKVNGTPVYQPGQITIPKHNTTGFIHNLYPVPGYNSTGYTPTSGYRKPNTPNTYNFQDPNQNNFRGYFQENVTSTPKYATPTPGSALTPVTPSDDADINVTQIACLLCNIGCPANYSRKGFYCVPNDIEYE